MRTLEISQGSDGSAPALSLGGLSLHRGRISTADLFVNDVEGWDTPPAVKGGPESNDSGDGDRMQPQHYASRVVTIEGTVRAKRLADRAQALRVIGGAAGNRLVPMAVTSAGLSSSAEVLLSGFEHDSLLAGAVSTRYTLVVKAPDPYRYGGWQAPVAMASDVRTEGIFHRGNTDSPPVLRVSGSAPDGYRISHEDGRYFEVLAPLVSGRLHIVDFATVRAYENGVAVSGYGRAQQLLVHKGMPQAMRIRPRSTGSVTAELEVQDVWI